MAPGAGQLHSNHTWSGMIYVIKVTYALRHEVTKCLGEMPPFWNISYELVWPCAHYLKNWFGLLV